MNERKAHEQPGVYLIHCRPTDSYYVGAAKNLRARMSNHLSALKLHRHDIPRLQRDWDQFGPDNFQFLLMPVSKSSLGTWEETLIHLTRSLEHLGGYNRMIGNRRWSLCAQIRDAERKLKRAGRFAYRKDIHPDDELAEIYFRTFQKPGDSGVLFEQETKNLRNVQIGERLRVMILDLLLPKFAAFDHQRGLHRTGKK